MIRSDDSRSHPPGRFGRGRLLDNETPQAERTATRARPRARRRETTEPATRRKAREGRENTTSMAKEAVSRLSWNTRWTRRAGNLGVVLIHDFAAEKVRTLSSTITDFSEKWVDPEQRDKIKAMFKEWGIDLEKLATVTNRPDADPFDLLCHFAYNAPLRTRRERADRLRADKKDFFDQYSPEARGILNELLDKYADHGTAQFGLPEALEVPPISAHGNVIEIAAFFGGPDKLVAAVQQLQTILYAA